jgi:hypothetical protein
MRHTHTYICGKREERERRRREKEKRGKAKCGDNADLV